MSVQFLMHAFCLYVLAFFRKNGFKPPFFPLFSFILSLFYCFSSSWAFNYIVFPFSVHFFIFHLHPNFFSLFSIFPSFLSLLPGYSTKFSSLSLTLILPCISSILMLFHIYTFPLPSSSFPASLISQHPHCKINNGDVHPISYVSLRNSSACLKFFHYGNAPLLFIHYCRLRDPG